MTQKEKVFSSLVMLTYSLFMSKQEFLATDRNLTCGWGAGWYSTAICLLLIWSITLLSNQEVCCNVTFYSAHSVLYCTICQVMCEGHVLLIFLLLSQQFAAQIYLCSLSPYPHPPKKSKSMLTFNNSWDSGTENVNNTQNNQSNFLPSYPNFSLFMKVSYS